MPTIFFYGPELDKEKKKELVESFTDTASEVTGISKTGIVVYVMGTNPKDVGVGGELLENRKNKK